MSPQALLQLVAAAVGLVIGSYLNVVVHRLPRRISTVLPRSRCPRCRALIRAWDNIPLLSFLVLRGRCRHCGGVIPWRYPLVEASTAACFMASFAAFAGPSGVPAWRETLLACLFCSAMIVLAMIDLEHYILPDVLTLPGIAVGLALQPWIPWSTFGEAVLGAVLGGAVLYAVGWLWHRFRGVWGMGLGDAKMLAMIGAFLGWKGVVSTLFVASLVGSLVGLGAMLAGRMHLRSKLPFGAFLSLGAVFSLFVGRDLLATYLRLVGTPWL